MLKRIRNYLIIFVFVGLLGGLAVANLFHDPGTVSYSERRRLTVMPEFNAENIFSAKYMRTVEDYLSDRFIGRDTFRSLKARFLFDVLRQKDNHQIYIADGSAAEYEGTLPEKSIREVAAKFGILRDKYLSDCNLYYAVIPDKNYFLAASGGYPTYDYGELRSILASGMAGYTEIELFDTLTVGDYYATDLHWDQSKILSAAERISTALGVTPPDSETLVPHRLSPFWGVYYGQSALPLEPDTLTYLTSPILDACEFWVLNERTFVFEQKPLYDIDAFSSIDPYNLFSGGTVPLAKIVNPNAATERRLLLFRDSFGSSLAPLLAAGGDYAEIILIDLRYIYAELLDQFIEIRPGDDALLIYNTAILSNSTLFNVK